MGNKTSLDFLYYTENMLVKSTLNRNFTLFSSIEESMLGENRSFIRLLFDDAWGYLNYTYLYNEYEYSNIPMTIRTRLSVIPGYKLYYTDSSSNCDINLYNITNENIELLNLLLEYRITGKVDISKIDVDKLTSNLSKIIYYFLQFELTKDCTQYIKLNTLCANSNSALESLYEMYVCNFMFEYLSNKQIY